MRVDIDAEQSWFQDAIDRYWELLAAEFNQPSNVGGKKLPSPPIGPPHCSSAGADLATVFQTYQTYRTDAEQRLAADLAYARQKGFSFGAKVVRGAYVDAENALAKRRGVASPIWPDKARTDKCYDRCVSSCPAQS